MLVSTLKKKVNKNKIKIRREREGYNKAGI